MKAKPDYRKFRAKFEAECIRLMAVHGPDGSSCKVAEFDHGSMLGVGGYFPGGLRQALRMNAHPQPGPRMRHLRRPELAAWDCITKLLAWYRARLRKVENET